MTSNKLDLRQEEYPTRAVESMIADFLNEIEGLLREQRVAISLTMASKLVEFSAFEAAGEQYKINVSDLILTAARLSEHAQRIS